MIEQDIRQQVRTLHQSGAADEQAIAVAKAESVRLRYTIEHQRNERATEVAMAVVLALIASLVLETLLSPQPRPDGPARWFRPCWAA